MARLLTSFREELAPRLQQELGLRNPMAVPRVEKITLNMGVGDGVTDRKAVDAACAELTLIAGQQAVLNVARKSVASFKLRDGMAIGCKVTLRRERMYEFLDRLINIAIPRIRDFRGYSTNSFDGRGNYNIGVTEQIMFPEIDFDKIDKIRGLDIAITTSARNDEQGIALLRAFGFPFRK